MTNDNSINNSYRANRHLNSLPEKPEMILVVDDEKRQQDSLMQLMAQQGYLVDSASNGAEAIEKLKYENIGIILLDLNMGGSNGEHVMQFITDHELDTAVIVVSGETSFEAAENALKYGAYDFIRKPYSLDNLLNSVNNAIKKTPAGSGKPPHACATA